MRDSLKSITKKILPKSSRVYIHSQLEQRKWKRYRKIYAGKGVKCVICNAEYKSYAPFGPKNRLNALCPSCGSLERHRLLWKYLHDKCDLFDGNPKKVLHFAPEKLFYDQFVSIENLTYHPVDLVPELYNYKGKIPIQKADITKIPFDNNQIDVIICNHVLEHIPDDGLAMSELKRVLKNNGGWSILQVPIDYNREKTFEDFSITSPSEREKVFGQNDHVRIYGRDYPERLKSAGFKVDADPYVNSFSKDEQFRFGLSPNHIIYKCSV